MLTRAAPTWRAPSRESRDVFFLLALIAWTIAPHLAHLPPWVGLLAFGVLAWRGALAVRQRPLPGRTAVLALLALAAALTFWGQRTLIGKEAGVTLLVVLMTLKTLELRARRDALVVFFLGFFLVLTNFLYSQSPAIAVSMGVSVWGWLTALTLAHMPAGRPSVWQAAKRSGRAALVGTPVMVLLFLLFPRVGPLWALPGDEAHTGLSEHLELGNVAQLASDDSIAFRLKFDGPPPPPERMYFRGPVLTDTDGRDWTAATLYGRNPEESAWSWPDVTLHGAPVRYTMTLEPTQLTWLPLLDFTPPPGAHGAQGVLVDAAVQPLDNAPIRVLPDLAGQWRTRSPIAQRVRLSGNAWFDATMDADASVRELRRDLALPPGAHPRTRAWAAQWATDHASADGRRDADALVGSLYRFIRTAGFSYTLTPGTYEGDAVDEFWLDRRAGFCEHFATAFATVLRAMGVPARVVTGYQGADALPVDGYIVVRQSNAHAWVEYWMPRRGWVRADPTAAVAPERIERGRTMRPPPGVVGEALMAVSPTLLDRLRRLRETVDGRWNEWVLGFNQTTQFDLMKRLGIATPDPGDLGHAMILLVVAGALVGAVAAWRDARRRTPGQRLADALAASLRPLAPHGVRVAAHVSPGGVAADLRRRFGAEAQPLAALLDALERRRYGPPGGLGAPGHLEPAADEPHAGAVVPARAAAAGRARGGAARPARAAAASQAHPAAAPLRVPAADWREIRARARTLAATLARAAQAATPAAAARAD
jgi:transglutaminase-like putative cysteine protease